MSFKAILLDIEGTTTPIDFVHKRLFPFARERVLKFVRDNFARLQEEIASLRAEHAKDLANGERLAPFDETSAEAIAEYLIRLIDNDRKQTALKTIQGQIWRDGYESGVLRGEVFDDVLPAFVRWRAAGRKIAIFSSGSVTAQKLIFKYSSAGDLTEHISAYFDTTTGAKKEAESYRKIAASLDLTPAQILFVSDSAAELDAAFAAGMQTRFSLRLNNPPIDQPIAHETIYSLAEIK